MQNDAAALMDEINRAAWQTRASVRSFARLEGFTDDGERAALASIAHEVHDEPILDLGVGAGRTVPILRSLSDDYTAIDYTPELVMACRHKHPNARILHGDARDLSCFPAETFKLVVFSFNGIDAVTTNAVPVVNRVSAGYPKDFTDLSYPRGMADEYIGCPDISDKDAFAARVHGDSMVPKYCEGDIVIFSPAAGTKSGDDCFVRFEDGHTTFKRVFFENDEAGRPVLRLQPRNEKYRAQTIASERVSGLYKAMFKYQRVDQD